jgi:hypothetical protein
MMPRVRKHIDRMGALRTSGVTVRERQVLFNRKVLDLIVYAMGGDMAALTETSKQLRQAFTFEEFSEQLKRFVDIGK